MGIETAHYYGWQGKRFYTSWWSVLHFTRLALLQVFRRKLYWAVFALALLNFLMFFAMIYAVTQFVTNAEMQTFIFDRIGFSPRPDQQGGNGYVKFLLGQNLVVMILLAFSGSLLVGSDFRFGSLSFYLSHGISRLHYILGKLIAVGTLIALVTIVPACALFIEYGFFTDSTDYWVDNFHIIYSILAFGAVWAIVLSIVIVTLSAYLQRMAPIVVAWTSIFLLLPLIEKQLRNATGVASWRLLSLWYDMRTVGKWCFDSLEKGHEQQLAGYCLAILIGLCSVLLILLYRRVRAIEVIR